MNNQKHELMKARIKNMFSALVRALSQLRRPSAAQNLRKLGLSSITPADFIIRDATAADIPQLSILHVHVWNETYWHVKQKPTIAIREQQWRHKFTTADDHSFCLIVTDTSGQFIGFAYGKPYHHSDLPDYDGELNKFYLLSAYQRLGIGRRMFGEVTRRFIGMGIHTMVLFGSAQNPSCAFYEKMGGQRLFAANGEFHGGYGWLNLQELVENFAK